MTMPGFLTRNLRLKLVAAVLATITWAGVVYASNPPDTRTVTVKVPQDPSALSPYVLVHPIQDLVLRVSGTREHLAAFDPADLAVSVNYHGITQGGTQQIPLNIVNNDHDVILDNAPSSVSAEVDHLGSRSVPVTVDIIKQPPQGYRVTPEAIQVTPSTVSVVGPQNQLASIRAKVGADLGSNKTNFQQDLRVFLYDAAGQRVSTFGITVPGRNDGLVQTTIPVVATVTSRASAVVPRLTGTPLAGHQLGGITVSPLSVVLSGPQDLLNTLDSVPTQSISLTGLDSSRTLTVTVQPPPGVTAAPSRVTVTITLLAAPTPAPTPVPTPSPTPAPTPSPT